MSKVSPTIPLSHIIASDAPLLSPTSYNDAQWEQNQHQALYSPPLIDNYALNFNYGYGLPPSPPNSTGSNGTNSPAPGNHMIKMRMSPDSTSENDQLCLPTHQVFDFPEVQSPPSPESDSPSPQMLRRSLSISSSAPSKREHSPAPSVSKRPRGAGERITTKDFIPPDVSGLSKREARLVKNRAAAFLSRQRKREEFETMEVRVTELEQENASLRALTQNGSGAVSHSDNSLLSEVEQLRAQLAAANERELELTAELERKSKAQFAAVKQETADPQFPSSPTSRSVPVSPPHKSGASLGLMVLLCALPSLLSMPTHNALPTSFSFPNPGSSALPTSASTFDFGSFIPNEYDWSRTPNGAMMDLDVDSQGRITTSTNPPPIASNARKLEFVDGNSEALGLGDLDISFDASPSENGKIRVRIHSSPPSSAAQSSRRRSSSSSSLSMWAGSQVDPSYGAVFSPPTSGYPPASSSSDRDPFLGANAAFGLSSPMSVPMPMGDFSSPVGLSQHTMFSLGSEFAAPAAPSPRKRRVRIALKSMPAAGGEGGEWEVEVR